MSEKIAFIGAGKMATAIVLGLLNSGVPAEKIGAYDISESAAMKFTEATGIKTTSSLADMVNHADTIILAVKPQFARTALSDVRTQISGKLLVSIAAGLSIKNLMEMSSCTRVIRVMPNVAAVVGEAMSCYAGAPNISEQDIKRAELILNAIGRSRKVLESQMDAVTGLSGSGPAYVLDFIMALADGGVYSGLSRDMAIEMAAQTVYGTALMALRAANEGKHLAELRDSVISPAGTTARGIMELEKGAFKATAASAVVASAQRSAELNKI